MSVLNPQIGIDRETVLTRRRYDRLAAIYDLRTYIAEEYLFKKFRQMLWSRIKGGRVLELGVGTGANIPYYPKECLVTAVDLSEQMLERAKRRAAKLGVSVELRLMDAQNLIFRDHSFDAAITTCVFCSVPNPVQGMRELGRVVKPGGNIWLMEHMRVDKPVIGPMMDFVNPFPLRMMGANINRRTVENVKLAGLKIETIEDLAGTVFRLIHAHPGYFTHDQNSAIPVIQVVAASQG
ncbi:MAG TPA: class I SAM-dependent methyltransferase [Anaerolineales bacterium]|nr:class I SAM-dependent methyltransferase [Anaerolineales bacterium]